MLEAVSLKVEYRTNPLGMDEPCPRFSWKCKGTSKCQKTYRITVCDEKGKTFWDSGTVESGFSGNIVYSGARFEKFTRYNWTLEVTDERGEKSSSEAFFETGFMDSPWKADWITGHQGSGFCLSAQRIFRDFEVSGRIASARLYMTALGVYEPRINGVKVSEDCMTPGYTDYKKRVQYQAYDVTDLIRNGANTLGVQLAEGWYSGRIARYWNAYNTTYGECPALKGELHIKLDDGRLIYILTDREFKTFGPDGAIRMSDIYSGETFEAWRDQTWFLPGGKRDESYPVAEINTKCKARPVWQSGAPVRRMREMAPKTITRRPSGTYIVDFGQNLTGRERFTLKNTVRGSSIVIKHGEMLNPDGSLYTENLRTALATTLYTCGGSETETYEPTFTFYGFRYLEISGWPCELTPDQIRAVVIYSDLEETGSFSCSEPMLNRLFSNIVWGQRSNFLDIPTDCPQRDERQGWTGDTQVFSNVATYNMDCSAFYTKWTADLNSCQAPDGSYPFYVPNPFADHSHATGWGDAGIIVPDVMLEKYGDKRIVGKYLFNMERSLDHQVEAAGNSYIVENAWFGDWLNIDDDTPKNYLATAYLAGMNDLLAHLARSIGNYSLAEKRERIFNEIKAAFNEYFFTENGDPKPPCASGPEMAAWIARTKSGDTRPMTQTAALLALNFNLVEGETYEKTRAFLVNDIKNTKNLHLSTGFLGTPLLLKVLTDIGELDLAYDLLMQTTYPSWLYPLKFDATTMWERWNSYSEKGFGDVSMNSYNHYAYGAVGEWFYETICGINNVSGGFKRFRLAPMPGKRLMYASASYDSSYGLISSSWKRSGGNLIWKFIVPCNTLAEIVPPGKLTASSLPAGIVEEGGVLVAEPGEYELDVAL